MDEGEIEYVIYCEKFTYKSENIRENEFPVPVIKLNVLQEKCDS